MPPRALSRHSYTTGIRDRNGAFILTTPTIFAYRELDDNEEVIVGKGDTLQTLAGRKYRTIDPERACGLWWIIGHFQQPPIFDPTIELEEGSSIIIPSVRTVQELIFDEKRRITG